MPLNNPGQLPLNSKIKSETRLGAAADGNVSYTGYGFKPRALIVIAGGSAKVKSTGFADVILTRFCVYQVGGQDNLSHDAKLVYMEASAGNYQRAILKSFDSDGFTLAWAKGGGGSADFTFGVLALG